MVKIRGQGWISPYGLKGLAHIPRVISSQGCTPIYNFHVMTSGSLKQKRFYVLGDVVEYMNGSQKAAPFQPFNVVCGPFGMGSSTMFLIVIRLSTKTCIILDAVLSATDAAHVQDVQVEKGWHVGWKMIWNTQINPINTHITHVVKSGGCCFISPL